MAVKNPVISVNKLGEYIVSKAARQRVILRQRKYPDPDFKIGMFHHEATDAIQQYFAGGAIDSLPLDNSLNSLNQKTPKKLAQYGEFNQTLNA